MSRPLTFLLGLAAAGALAVGAAHASGGYDAAAAGSRPAAHGSHAPHEMASMYTTVLPRAGTKITIKNYGYTVPASVKHGATITVVNNDAVKHSVTANGGQFRVTVKPGAQKTFTAPAKGTYRFSCKFHSSMTGKLVVT